MLIRVHPEADAADALAVMLDRPGVDARIRRPTAGGQVLAGVVAAAIPFPPPRRAVAVLFLRINRMAQPVIDIRFPGFSQDDALPPQRGQWRQRQPVQHDPTLSKPPKPACRRPDQEEPVKAALLGAMVKGGLNTETGEISPDRGNHATGAGRTHPAIPRRVRYLVRYLACTWLCGRSGHPLPAPLTTRAAAAVSGSSVLRVLSKWAARAGLGLPSVMRMGRAGAGNRLLRFCWLAAG